MTTKTLIIIFLFGLTTQFGYGQNTVLAGRGESGIAGYYNDWVIKILNNNLIEMLCSVRKDSLDIRSMNIQYFGRIIPSDNYDYKVVIDKSLTVDDCILSTYGYIESDTIPFYIDSTLFKEIKYWDLGIKRLHNADTIIRIVNTFYPLCIKLDKEIIMTLYPEKESGYFPILIKTNKKCAVDIGNQRPSMDYYINKKNDGYELIRDITPYVNMQNKKCVYCIKKTILKIR